MDKAIFQQFRDLVYQKSGITLHDGKEALVSSRVSKRMRALSLTEYQDYLNLIHRDTDGEELVQLLDAISTNVTHFFREGAHFEFAIEQFSKWLQAGQTRFRFWSAASSTGEEPYSLAMSLLNTAGSKQLDLKILATDISTRVLGHCLQGLYEEEKVKTIPTALRDRYMTREVTERGNYAYRVNDEVKKQITFRRMNLSTPPFPMQGPMDIVFCRNVMIYFDDKVRLGLLGEIERILKPGGYLMVGHAESLTGMLTKLKPVKPSIYCKI